MGALPAGASPVRCPRLGRFRQEWPRSDGHFRVITLTAVWGHWPLGVWVGAGEKAEALVRRPQSSPTETGPSMRVLRGGAHWKENSGFWLEQPAARCRLLRREDGRDSGGARGTPMPRRHQAGTSTRGWIDGSSSAGR